MLRLKIFLSAFVLGLLALAGFAFRRDVRIQPRLRSVPPSVSVQNVDKPVQIPGIPVIPAPQVLNSPQVKTLEDQLADNQRQVQDMERAIQEAHVIERLNSHRLSAQESRPLYEMIDAVARMRAQGIELRLQRLQARLDGGGR